MALRLNLTPLAIAGLCLFLNQTAQADILIHTVDGRTIRVPLASSQVRSIEFTSEAAPAATQPPAAPAVSSFDGRWRLTSRAGGSSSAYNMQMSVSGTRASGTYDKSGGRVNGSVQGNTFDGYWYQSVSGKRCAAAREGTFYWGRKKLTLVGSDRLEGSWSYCDDAFIGTWTGTRIQ